MNIGFYFLNYNNENHISWLQLLENISSFSNEIHIIHDYKNGNKLSKNFNEHSLDLSKRFVFLNMSKKILNDIDSLALDSCKIILRNSGHYNLFHKSYLSAIAQKWDDIIEKNNLDAIYLMEPLNVPYISI